MYSRYPLSTILIVWRLQGLRVIQSRQPWQLTRQWDSEILVNVPPYWWMLFGVPSPLPQCKGAGLNNSGYAQQLRLCLSPRFKSWPRQSCNRQLSVRTGNFGKPKLTNKGRQARKPSCHDFHVLTMIRQKGDYAWCRLWQSYWHCAE